MIRNKTEKYFIEWFSTFGSQWKETNEFGPNGFALKIKEAEVSYEISVNQACNSLKSLSMSITQCRCLQAFLRYNWWRKLLKVWAVCPHMAVWQLTSPLTHTPFGQVLHFAEASSQLQDISQDLYVTLCLSSVDKVATHLPSLQWQIFPWFPSFIQNSKA